MASRYFGSGETEQPQVQDDGGAEASAPSVGEPRMALLVGNARYSQGALGNPVNDVLLIGGALTRLGFTVTTLEDADKPTFHGAVVDFCTRLEQAGSAATYKIERQRQANCAPCLARCAKLKRNG